MPVLYAETRESGSDEVAGLQRKKQASIPIYRKFSRVKSYADAFFVPFFLHMSIDTIIAQTNRLTLMFD